VPNVGLYIFYDNFFFSSWCNGTAYWGDPKLMIFKKMALFEMKPVPTVEPLSGLPEYCPTQPDSFYDKFSL